ncbi:MAG: exonuclease domain-containing protein [Myxococcota bacterium]
MDATGPHVVPAPWYMGKLAALDTETTGLSPEQGDRVIELAIVHFEHGEVTDRWSVLVDPGMPLHPDVTRITGIRDEDLSGKPRFADVAAELISRVEGRLLVAYNASFDRSFVMRELARAGASMPQGLKWLDPLVFAKELHKGQGAMKLGVVAKRLGIPLEEAHRATADAECAGRVLLALAKDLPPTFEATWDLQEMWEGRQEAERAGWKSRQQKGGRATLVGEVDGPRNALGAGYPLSDELDPVRYMYLRAAGRG